MVKKSKKKIRHKRKTNHNTTKVSILLFIIFIVIGVSIFVYFNISTLKTLPKNQNKKHRNNEYQKFKEDFELNTENQTRNLEEAPVILSKALDSVLNSGLVLNNTNLSINSSLYVNFEENKYAVHFKYSVLLELFVFMNKLDMGNIEKLTDLNNTEQTLVISPNFVIEYYSYRSRIKILNKLVIQYKEITGDLESNVFYSFAVAFIKAYGIRMLILSDNIDITVENFNQWQSVKENKYILVFLKQFENIVLGMPLFMIFNFIKDQQIRVILEKEAVYAHKYKVLLEHIWQIDSFSDKQNDIIKGKFYKLFSLLESKDEPNLDIYIFNLMVGINTDLKLFLDIYKY